VSFAPCKRPLINSIIQFNFASISLSILVLHDSNDFWQLTSLFSI
jgi:hypothetical protein